MSIVSKHEVNIPVTIRIDVYYLTQMCCQNNSKLVKRHGVRLNIHMFQEEANFDHKY